MTLRYQPAISVYHYSSVLTSMVGVEGIEPPMPQVTAGLRPAALPTEHHSQTWRKVDESNAHPEGATVFRTVCRPFSGTFRTGGAPESQTQSALRLCGVATRCLIVRPALRFLLVSKKHIPIPKRF